jgi:antitoxin (DNA-binding transcriptional repressor) of toxin-antitoxin stability system
MTRVSVAEFRKHLHAYLDLTAEGEVVQLLRRGKIVAVLARPEDARDVARMRLQGLRRSAAIGDVTSPVDVGWEADAADPRPRARARAARSR